MTTLLALVLALVATPLSAAELPLPPSARDVVATIAAACPECAQRGYTPCGSPDVQWGKGFAAHAFLGTPPRAYLVTFTMRGEDFRAFARHTDYAALLRTYRDRFAGSRLVVIEDDWASARVLSSPSRVAVGFPKPLHDCVHESNLPWACCAGDCNGECCEKSLGSPTVTLTWPDGEETITFHYSHTIGLSWLGRQRGEQATRYACLSDSKGELRSSEPHR
jgi:hypothetical protein